MSKSIYFHGSPHLLEELKAGSWVTPYMLDALIFGVPWDSTELVDTGGPDGRPPSSLQFKDKTKIPEDCPIYLYMVKGKTKPADTNTGKKYDWNRQITYSTPVELIYTVPSWQNSFLVK